MTGSIACTNFLSACIESRCFTSRRFVFSLSRSLCAMLHKIVAVKSRYVEYKNFAVEQNSVKYVLWKGDNTCYLRVFTLDKLLPPRTVISLVQPKSIWGEHCNRHRRAKQL